MIECLKKKKTQIEDYKTKIYELKNIEETVKKRKRKSRRALIFLTES